MSSTYALKYSASSIRSVVLPLTPQQQYDLGRKWPLRANMAGGYLVAEAFTCVQNSDRMGELSCQFKVIDQAVAPIALL